MKKRRAAKYYKNTDGTLSREETLYGIIDDKEVILHHFKEGEPKYGAQLLSAKDYNEAQELGNIKLRRERIAADAKKLDKKVKAVKELEKLGLTKEAAKIVVYG